MKRFFCCLKGEGSGNAVQDPPEQPEQPQQPQPPERVRYEKDEIGVDAPFGNNEFLNNAWRNNIELPDDRDYSDSDAVVFPSSPPLRGNCGETFPWYEILDGTQNLLQARMLGGGNFGDVFRCDLQRIHKVGAAKIQDPENESGHTEFIAEVTTLHAADHPNVTKLLGKCYGLRHRAIVYEFMPNGSLDQHLFPRTRQGQDLTQDTLAMDWDTRMRIALGVAEGLVYVHEELKVIHRDIKAANILLDDKFVPKLTDFGLATEIVLNEEGIEQQTVIRPVKGTPGYIAPETEQSGSVSTKSDVYSYGVLLLQLFTGKIAVDVARPTATMRITDWFRSVWNREGYTPTLVIDFELDGKFSVEGFNRLLQAATMCIDAQVSSRPDMRMVETMIREAAAYPVQEGPSVTESLSV